MVSPVVQAGPLLVRALPLITSAALFLAARAEADFGPEALIGPAAGHLRWRIHLSPGTRVVGAVLGGYHAPDGLEGLESGTPVLTRVHDYGEKPLHDYPGRTDPGPGVKELARELTGRDPASFQGAEKGERYRIGAGAAR
jgi:hypothetical protein